MKLKGSQQLIAFDYNEVEGRGRFSQLSGNTVVTKGINGRISLNDVGGSSEHLLDLG